MITLTETAAVKVKELIEGEGEEGLALRVAVRPGGCSGFSYEMFFDSEIDADDLSQAYGDVKVVVDPASAQMLDIGDGMRLVPRPWRVASPDDAVYFCTTFSGTSTSLRCSSINFKTGSGSINLQAKG